MTRSISVIIPFYRGKQWLKDALCSVFSQSEQPQEVILINDGSPENIDSIVREYEGKIHYIQTENRGAAAARNTGIRVATGKYVAFLDSDDLWLPDKLQRQWNLMEQAQAVWSITSYTVFDDVSGQTLRTVDCTAYRGQVFPKILYSSPIATPSVMILRDVLTQHNLCFAEGYALGEDSHLWNQLAMLAPLQCISQPCVKVRWRGSNAASNVVGQIQARHQIYDLLLQSPIYNPSKFPISKGAVLAISYCRHLTAYANKHPGISTIILEILYFPAKLYFKILSRM